MTVTDPKRIAALHKQGGVYKPMSEITPGTQDVLDLPTPAWLDREYPYVAPPGEGCTLKELDYLISLIPLREKMAPFIKAADEDMAGLFVTLCSELGAPCDRQALDAMTGQAAVLITKMKWLYNRPRPYQIAAKHNRLAGQGQVTKPGDFWPMDTKTAHSPAYPSGHTIQAYLLASRLSETAPQHRKVFMKLAHMVSFSRAVGGYHWPSDLTFAKDVFRHIVSPHMPSSIRVAAKYKDKKEVPKSDGKGTTTVYEYGPRQVAKRHKDKAVRIEALRKKMGDLRQKARADLTASDPETRLTALAVCLMDETYERVGNEQSAKDGHYGVTNWTADHITLSDKAATIKYTGKSGVKHEKKVTNARVLSALRKALKGKGKGDKVLCDGDECSILAKDVNAYLKPYGITAKDIRGLHANEEMKHHLKAQRKAGPADLPHSRKEKDEILKAEFQAALDLAAAAVGHEPSTLRSQYLVPSMEDSYVHDGTVIDKLDKVATLSDAEREDREAERLVKKSPKKKPPRLDRERRIVQDKDNTRDPDKVQDDKDTSNRSRDAAVRVALLYMISAEREERNVGDVWSISTKQGERWYAKKEVDGKPVTRGFKTKPAAEKWKNGEDSDGSAEEGGGAEKAETAEKSKPLTDEAAVDAIRNVSKSLSDNASEVLGKLNNETLQKVLQIMGDPGAAVLNAVSGASSDVESAAEVAEKVLDRIPDEKPPTDEEVREAEITLRKINRMDTGLTKKERDRRRDLKKKIESLESEDTLSDAQEEELREANDEVDDIDSRDDLPADLREEQRDAEDLLRRVPDGGDLPSPEEIAKALVAVRAKEVREDPAMLDPSNPLTNLDAKPLRLTKDTAGELLGRMAQRTSESMGQYRLMSSEERRAHREKLSEMISKLESDGAKGSEQYEAATAQMRGLNFAAALEDGDDAEGVSPSYQALLGKARDHGMLDDLVRAATGGGDDEQTVARKIINKDLPTKDSKPADLQKFLDGIDDEHPTKDALTAIFTGGYDDDEEGMRKRELFWKNLKPEARDLLLSVSADLMLYDVSFTDMESVKQGMATGEIKKSDKAKKKRQQARQRFNEKAQDNLSEIEDAAAAARRSMEEAERRREQQQREMQKRLREQAQQDGGTAEGKKAGRAVKSRKSDALYGYNFAPWGDVLSSLMG